MCRSVRILCAAYVAAFIATTSTAPAQVVGSDLLVANMMETAGAPSFIQVYYGSTGQFRGQFTQGNFPDGQVTAVYGPNGNLYVGSQNVLQIRQFNGTNGALIGTTVPNNVFSGMKFTFGQDGNLYYFRQNGVGSASIERVNPVTGTNQGTFVPDGSGGLQIGSGALLFGPDGNLYASTNNRVLRYDGTTGAFLGTFVTAGSGGLSNPVDMLFLPNGNLLVSSATGSNAILQYSGTTGAFLGVFASGNGLNQPWGMAMGPDGRLYVASEGSNQILRFNGTTGQFVDGFVSQTVNASPTYIAFTPSIIPEPTALCLVGMTAIVHAVAWRRRKLRR